MIKTMALALSRGPFHPLFAGFSSTIAVHSAIPSCVSLSPLSPLKVYAPRECGKGTPSLYQSKPHPQAHLSFKQPCPLASELQQLWNLLCPQVCIANTMH